MPDTTPSSESNQDRPADRSPQRSSSFRNWISLTGLAIIVASLFSMLLLFGLDYLAHFGNPYIGVAIYIVCPALVVAGILLGLLGALWRRWRIHRAHGVPLPMQIDMGRPRDRKILGVFAVCAVGFLLFASVTSYRTYHFTESVQFCGQACHTVMKPELVTYQHSPHARVACTECHIGPGAKWFVRSKLSGLHQVYAVAANKFPRPVPTPIKNLRPAQITCEQCHWPQKFVGNLDRTYTSYMTDEKNTEWTTRLSLKVGGGDPTHGPVGGIHWHMNVGNKVEYIALDEARQNIPWVRLTEPQGIVKEFRVPGWTNDIKNHIIRLMDCMDCHNRPAHIFKSPNDAVNLAMSLGKIDPTLPYIKSNAVDVLLRAYQTETEALQGIATVLADRYRGDARIRPVIDVVQQIYKDNFFPEMKASWKVYHDNLGHKDWAGCFRCHAGKHKTADGRYSIKANDCNACHTILAQGSGPDLEKFTPGGQGYIHPGGEIDEGWLCNDCHTGGL